MITELNKFIEGLHTQMTMIVENISGYLVFDDNQRFKTESEKMLNEVRGCGRFCLFCNALCQKGYHSLDEKHSCDSNEGGHHHLRAFASGVIEEGKVTYPSVYTCNVID